MLAYVIRRVLLAIPTLLGVILVTFFLVRVTGDPSSFVLGETAPQSAIDEFRAQHGLDKPLLEQLWSYINGILHGDLGTSIRNNQPVTELFMSRLPATLQLGLTAFGFAIIVGVTLGVLSSVFRNSFFDQAVRLTVIIGQAVPGFYLGLLLIIFIGAKLQWLPTGGRGGIDHLILPVLTLSSHLIAVIVRFTRATMLDVLHLDYVRTARAKGLTERTIIIKHALRNVLIPLLTLLALQSSVLFSGAVVTETVFAWPGVGRFAYDAISQRDFPIVQGTVLILTVFVVLLNLLVDVAYALVDPRIRY